MRKCLVFILLFLFFVSLVSAGNWVDSFFDVRYPHNDNDTGFSGFGSFGSNVTGFYGILENNAKTYENTSTGDRFVGNNTHELCWFNTHTRESSCPNRGSFSDDLVSYWAMESFNFSDYTIDDFVGGNDGVLNGKTFNDGTVNGDVQISDGAMVFDGSDDYVDLPQGETTDDGSISVWAYGKEATGEKIIQRTGGARPLILYEGGNTVTFSVYNGSDFTKVQGTISTDKWEHITVTWEKDNKIQVFVNGNLEEEKSLTGTVDKSTVDWSLGAQDGSSAFFNGSIDDVRIYDRALSDNEVTGLYESTNNKRPYFDSPEVPNEPPYSPILNFPDDSKTGVSLDPILNVTVSDINGDDMNVSFYKKGGGLSGAEYTGKTFSTVGDTAYGIDFEENGNYLYSVDFDKHIYQYSCSDVWNISSCSYDGDNLSLSNLQGDYFEDIHFKPDGTKLFVGDLHNNVYQYSCSDAWNISSCSYDNNNLSLFDGQGDDLININFKPDGTRLYTTHLGGEVRQSDCSDAWNISSCSYDSKRTDLKEERPDIGWGGEGKYMYEGGYTSEVSTTYYFYRCSQPYDINSCSRSDVSFHSQGDTRSMYLNSDISRLYGLDKNGVVHQNKLGSTFFGSVVNIENNSHATYEWNGLNELTTYEWYVQVDDGENVTYSSVWNFTTGDFSSPTVSNLKDLSGNTSEIFRYDFNFSDSSNISNVTVNDSMYFEIYENGTFFSTIEFDNETFIPFSLCVTDEFNNTGCYNFSLTLTHPSSDQLFGPSPDDDVKSPDGSDGFLGSFFPYALLFILGCIIFFVFDIGINILSGVKKK